MKECTLIHTERYPRMWCYNGVNYLPQSVRITYIKLENLRKESILSSIVFGRVQNVLKMYSWHVSAYISTGQVMGWGHKAIEIRSAETGHLDGVFMHKKAQKLKFLCERNDKVKTIYIDVR